MTKRILAMVLVLAMVLSLLPSVVLAEGAQVVRTLHAGQHTDAGHADDCGVTSGWNAWGDDPEETGLPTSGNWYLTKDVHITGGANTTGNLNLCLNGYVIYKTGTGRIYGTQSGAENTMTICDCTAYEENGVYYAGALTGGKMTSQDGGGAIFVRRQGTLKIYDGRFIRNTYQHNTETTGGGAIMLQGVSSGKFATVKIYGGEFAENKAFKADGVTGNSGGVIGSGGSAVIEIEDGIFRDNFGGEGGAISLGTADRLTITGGTFTNNSGKSGGAIYGASSTVSISGATFTGNSATTSGSVLHNNGSMDLTIGNGTVITGNTGTNTNADEGYSAAVAMCGSAGKLTLTGKVIIAENTTGATGVASLNFNKAASDTLYVNELTAGSCVEFSTSKTVPAQAGDVIAVDGTQSSWTNGWVAHMGINGELQYIGYDSGVFSFVDAHVHTLCNDTGCTEHTNQVIYEPWGDDPEEEGKLPTEGNWYLTKSITVSGEALLTKAEDLNLCLNGKTVTGYSASKAHAYATTSGVASVLNISDCTAKTENGVYTAGKFTGFTNTHSDSGAACIFVRKGSTLNFFDGIIEKCVSASGGPAIFLNQSTGYLYDGLITNNRALNGTAKKHGGGVFAYKSNLTMYGGEISHNDADQGGGIYLYDSTATVCGGKISNNTANWGAGVAFKDGKNTLDMQGGSITGNVAASNGGGVQAAFATATVKVSGNVNITGNTLTGGAANNVRLGGSGYITVGALDTNAQVGITATAGRVFSHEVTGDPSNRFLSDDDTQTVFLNGDNKLQLKDKPAAPPANEHKHTLCNDTGCTEHTGEVVYQPWPYDDRLPTDDGNWYLTKDVTVSSEVNLSTAITLNLCLNGKTVTGNKGSNIRAYSTTNNVASTINVSNCATTGGSFENFDNTSTGTGGGVFFIRANSTLRVFDVTFKNNKSACMGGAIGTAGKTYIYDCEFNGNQAVKSTGYADGGAIYVNALSASYGELYVYGADFIGNRGQHGAAVYSVSKTTVYMDNVTFDGNIASNSNNEGTGGAYRATNATTTIKNATIKNNQANVGAALCVYAGEITLENVEMTGNHTTHGYGAFHMNRNNAGADPITVTLKGKVVIDGNTYGVNNEPQNLYMRHHEAYVNATGLTAGSKIGVSMHENRIAAGLMNITIGQNGTDNSGYFASDNTVDWQIAMGQEVYLKSTFSHTHCECGKTDCSEPGHKQVEYQPWRDATKLPDSGNYCLMTDVTITKEEQIASDLTLCLNGHKVTGTTGKGVRFISTSGKNNEVLTIADCKAKTVDGVYTAGGFYGCVNTHTGSGGGAIFIRKGGTLKFYDGIVSGNASATGGGAFYIKEATATFYGGLIEKNIAGYQDKWYNGGAAYLDNATVTVYDGVFSENEAAYGGGFHMGGNSTLDIRGGKITNNIAYSNGAGIQAASANADVKFSGEPVIMGNKLESGKANNVRLGATGVIDVENLGQKAQIGITANAFRTISTKTKDYADNFVSDEATLTVLYQDEALFMGASGDHKHCACIATSTVGCDHGKVHYAQWNDPTSLPTSGNYYLSVDVVVSGQIRLENATLNLCLNGHTIKVGDQGGRVYYITNGGKLTISDCAGKGVITGATAAAILTNASGTDMEVNLYGGTFTGNHSKGSGSAIVIQGQCTFNMYGGKLTGNTASSYLKTDADGKVILDSKGNQTYTNANGGALYVSAGTFNMYGGEISGNEVKAIGYLKAGATKETMTGGIGGAAQITGKATANLYGGKISGNTGYNGGGVFVSGEGSVLNLLGTEICGNTAKNGGGVISQTLATTYMKAGKITGNTATASGAGFYVSTGTTLYMSGGEICQNTAADGETAKNGGGLYIHAATVEFTGGKVWGNKAASGAGMYSSATTTNDQIRPALIYIKDGALITDNHASENGGGVMMSGIAAMTAGEGSKIIMTGGEVSKNTAINAAGILTQTKAALELSGGKITENKASGAAGGIYISTGTKLTMTGGEIVKNTAKGDGGGMYMLRSTGIFKGGFVSNNTGANGAGMKLGGAKVDIYNLSVVGNQAVGKTTVNATTGESKYTAGTGAGINVGRAGYKKNGVQLYQTPVVNIYGIYVANNHATGAAGGMLIQSKDTVFNMHGGTVTGNVSENNGGAIYLSTDVKATITGGTLSNNQAKGSGAIHILNNSAKISGVKVYGNEVTNAAGAFTITGKTTDVTIKNCQIYNNTAGGHVGAIASQGYANMTLEDSKIYGNKCGGTGGAIYFSNPGYGTLRNVEIYENEAGKQAGAVFLGVHSAAVFENVTIRDNVASTEYGGGICNRGRIELSNCKILNNTVKNGSGGGIGSFKTSSLLLGDDAGVFAENCVISGNQASQQGGGVYGHRGCPVYLTDCVITDNTSAAEGGGVFADGRLGMQNVTVTGNTSGGEGFAVYLTPSEFDGHTYQTGHKKMSGDMVIKDNTGGDLYLAEGTAIAVTGEGLGQKSHVNVTIFSGVVTQWVQGVYNYEGGDLNYVLTAGNRSITDPEPIPASENDQKDQDASGDILLYVIIGVFAVAVIAVIAVIIAKKKKKTPIAGKE